jgi:hypothetical protein
MLPAVTQAQFTLKTNNDNTITLVKYQGHDVDVVIPSMTNGMPVTSIQREAFIYATNLVNVMIPQTVTNIGSGAFWRCMNLTSVTIPDTITSIKPLTFRHCHNLTNVTMGKNVASIEFLAFSSCFTLKRITLPNSVIAIKEGAFYACTNLTEVFFNGNAPSLGTNAFLFDLKATIFRLPNATGWGNSFGERPTAIWRPTSEGTTEQPK